MQDFRHLGRESFLNFRRVEMHKLCGHGGWQPRQIGANFSVFPRHRRAHVCDVNYRSVLDRKVELCQRRFCRNLPALGFLDIHPRETARRSERGLLFSPRRNRRRIVLRRLPAAALLLNRTSKPFPCPDRRRRLAPNRRQFKLAYNPTGTLLLHS